MESSPILILITSGEILGCWMNLIGMGKILILLVAIMFVSQCIFGSSGMICLSLRWFIDYWMEGGLMRDIFTHKLTSKEHWDDLLKKPFYSRADLDYNNYVSSGTVVPPSYDPHCANGEISDGCEPVAIISADKLRDYADGPAETTKIANALMMNTKTGQFLIAQEAWDCIWKELIEHKKGKAWTYSLK